ncbi:MAG: prepilin-type N-terminal cleavage/methylation domain-containing protein [Gammaproteobacteria bacterium]|nr:prepilin-type N-terminal cleavage/methylation domain-containing protein [Gammaproteobacteria bacterium]
MQKYSKQSGFTLLEFIIVIILIGILIAGSSNLLSVGFNSFFSEKNIINANWQGSVALERITRDLRAVCSPSDITVATANRIIINDLNNDTIDYQVVSNQLLRNAQPLADGVQSITLDYYKKDSTLLPFPIVLQDVRYVVITLNMSYNNLTFPITTAIYLWNLR